MLEKDRHREEGEASKLKLSEGDNLRNETAVMYSLLLTNKTNHTHIWIFIFAPSESEGIHFVSQGSFLSSSTRWQGWVQGFLFVTLTSCSGKFLFLEYNSQNSSASQHAHPNTIKEG